MYSVLIAKVQALLRRAYDFNRNSFTLQAAGAVLNTEDAILSREKDGTLNEDYCRWCYADGTYTYSDMDDLIETCIPHMTKEGFPEDQARSYTKQMLPELDYWKRQDELRDKE